VIRIGLVLPSFRYGSEEALDTARQAESAGLDAVFCFDHLWPMGQPERPALAPFPLLGAVAGCTDRVVVGTLVARVGLVPDEILVSEFAALDVVAPGRVLAGLGTGDHKSMAENVAYGVPAAPAEERQAALAVCARSLQALGIPVWIGAGSRATNEVARAAGAALNLWGASPAKVAESAAAGEVTWAGPPLQTTDAEGVLAVLRPIVAAGASWVVLASPTPLDALGEAARRLRDETA
jgi:alkanesulfonate monooxygenase SsuD/methylene tetrahydromethanopterin reductase-like flavin-dependent oxidoreductase (luciferase family)